MVSSTSGAAPATPKSLARSSQPMALLLQGRHHRHGQLTSSTDPATPKSPARSVQPLPLLLQDQDNRHGQYTLWHCSCNIEITGTVSIISTLKTTRSTTSMVSHEPFSSQNSICILALNTFSGCDGYYEVFNCASSLVWTNMDWSKSFHLSG